MSSLLTHSYVPRARATSLDDVPLSPHAYDDEFNGTVLDAKWTLNGGAVPFVTTAIDPYALFTTESRYSLNSYRPSWLMLQTSSYFNIRQTVVLPSECFVWGRFSFNMRYSGVANDDHEIGIHLASSTTNNSVSMYLNGSAAGACYFQALHNALGVFTLSQGRDLYPGTSFGAASSFHQPFCYVGIQKIATTYHYCVGAPNGHWIWLTSQTHATTMDRMGIAGSSFGTAGAPGNMITGCDFIRYKAGRFLP